MSTMNQHVPQFELTKSPEVTPADIMQQLAIIVMAAEERDSPERGNGFIAIKGTSKGHPEETSGAATRITLYLTQEDDMVPEVQRLAHIVYREDGLLVAQDVILKEDSLRAVSIKKDRQGKSVYRLLDQYFLAALGERLNTFEPASGAS